MIPKKFIEFYGDAFRWFTGKVVSVQDPLQIGRVQVRIHGIHTDNLELIPNEDLPWGLVINHSNHRENTLGLQVNAFVFGIFLDGQNSQIPMVVGTLNQEGNTNPLSTGTQTKSYTPDSKIGEPDDPYAAVYPSNLVYETSAGHVKEYDNTDSAERIRELHKSGTFYQVNPDGDFVEHLVKDRYTVIAGNDAIHVSGNVNVFIDGVANITCPTTNLEGDFNITGNVSIDGSVEVTGSVQAEGEVTGNDVNLSTHTHNITSGSSAGVTATPNK